MAEASQERIGTFWMWCFGFKVLLALTLIYILAWLPLGTLSWLVCVLAGINEVNQSTTANIIMVTASIIWFPFAFGWMVHYARDWFDMGLGKDD